MGEESAKGMLRGIGFTSWAQFTRFLETGEITKDKTKRIDKKTGNTYYQDTPKTITQHTGGWAGKPEGNNTRKGVARNVRGLHSSEQLIRAQKEEFIVNRHDAKRNADVLEHINRGGTVDSLNNRGPRGAKGGDGPGAAGLMSGVINKMMLMGVQKGINNAYAKKSQQMATATAGSTFGVGKAGMYGDRSFSAEQLKNAAIIASVGSSMGMSARDIQIGIMTAIAESGLINVDYGDRDSLGLFQQRPSMGWGTPEQVTNPEYAARAFFGPLKAHTERLKESPWLAAQHIQRSAFADGSNYLAQWDSAQAIFNKGLIRSKSGGFTAAAAGLGAGFQQGNGGWHKPSTPGKGWSNSHDYRNGIGSPLFAAADGRITESRAVTSGGSPGNGQYGTPYRSYGETIVLDTGAGKLRYAHLNPGGRYVRAGQMVKGGSLIGASGNTGNSTGPHTHFDVNGDYNASGWMAAHGISLRKGAQNVRWDNTIANLHKGEAVLTEDLNRKFHQGVDNFANGGNAEYNVNVYVNGTNASADEIANAAIGKMKRLQSRKPQSRRG